ncbi:beta-N-acetylhexosaminidase [Leifsonia sp. Leaf336]|uniref:beta-N-acetylhexosaminidase n=1 Tax=Leifsonia sp. Leaf336 TaxID=1736341 RepID=UPI0007018BD2|nr:beta-N-acetylhexosaminidase [Leifsonia sp. Leaf336]KQR53908.1 beta-N-acetylhexosaminidase [Leifsonia sp. Leaf336]
MVVPRPAQLANTGDAPFTLLPGARIIVAGTGAETVGRLLRDELATDCRRDLVVVHEPPAFGDIAIVIADDEGPVGHPAEGYTLEVAAEGVRIGAATAAGAFWGVQTLRQLVPAACDGDPLTVDAVRISDHPRFAYRGAMLDVARHFFPPADVKRFIDAIVLLKVNHLHLHLTDDQGWRIEIASWPELTLHGGSTGSDGSPGGFYTADEYRDLVAYAAERCVTIVPEIDMPGHTNAALASYPELNADGVAPALYTGSEVGFSTLQTGDAVTDRFVREVIGEVAALTPGPYLHIGGDECLSTPEEDFLAFIDHAAHVVTEAGKIPVGWHEMGRSSNLPGGTVGQYWSFRTPREGAADETLSFVRAGGAVIMSPADVAYLDIVYEEGDPIGQDWADGATDLRSSYEWDPARIVPGLGDAHILGVEAPVWTETIATIEQVEDMAFPRLAAVAEIGWSAAPADTADIDTARDFDAFTARIAQLAEHWDALGTSYRRVADVPWPESVAG